QTIVTLSLDAKTTPKTVFQGAKGHVVLSPTLSADGHLLAYELKLGNESNIYVDSVPPTGMHQQVTTDGGENPMWSDGKHLVFVRENRGTGKSTFYSLEVFQTGASLDFGKAAEMFSVDGLFIQGSGPGNIVDVSPDGKWFVTLRLPTQTDREAEQGQVNVVLDWFDDLKKRVGVN